MKFARLVLLLAAVATAAVLAPFSTAQAADTTPPELVRGEIDGGTVTIIFSEALDEDSVGGMFRVVVQLTDNATSLFDATGEVNINGRTVTIGVGEGKPRAKAGYSNNSFFYMRPKDGSQGLRDLAGNLVRAAQKRWDDQWLRSRIIILDNVTGVAPAVTRVEVSSDAGADATYGLGDTIRVRLTFSRVVAVTGTPRLKIDFGAGTGDEKWAVYESGGGTTTLEFAYTAVEQDLSTQGVAVLANTLELNGGAIRSWAGGEDAALANGGLAHDANHKVDGRRSRAPTVSGVAMSSNAGADETYAQGETIGVRLTFSEAVAVSGAPRLKVDFGSGTGDEKWAVYEKGGGSATLDFAYAVAQGDASGAGVAVLANTLELNGGTIRSAATQADADRTHTGLDHDPAHKVDGTPPTLFQAAVEGVTLTLIFDETLGATAALANGAFTVKKTPHGGSEQNVSLSGSPAISGRRVTLTLANAVSATDTDVKVSYARPNSGTGNRLRDEAGNEVAGFSDRPVRKGPPDTTPPRLLRAEVDGVTVTLFFSEALDPDSAGGRFGVVLQTSRWSPDSIYGTREDFYATGDVEISGNRVTIGVGEGNPRAKPNLLSNDFYYRKPEDSGQGLRDLAGNAVQNTPYINLVNVTKSLSVTGVAVTSDAGADATYGLGEKIQVTLTFGEAVAVTGTPRVKIDFGSGTGDEKWAVYEDGGGTTMLVFAYTVAEPDLSTGGIAVLANTLELNGGAIRSAAGSLDAALAHAGLAHDPAHRVAGAPSALSVAVTSSAGDDDTYAPNETIQVTLAFSEAVNVTGAPRLKIDFGSGAGDEKWAVYAEGSGTTTLKFAYTVAQGDSSNAGVAVLANTLELAGGAIGSVASVRDVNLAHAGRDHDPAHRVDARPPSLSVASVNGATLKLVFDEALGAAASLANGAFTVKKTPQGGSEETSSLSGSPAVNGATVTLTLAEAVSATDTDVKVGYARPGSGTGNRLRDAAGNEAAGFSDEPVTNVSGDTTPPRLVRGEIDGGTITLSFSEALDPDSAGGRFVVNVQISDGRWHQVRAAGDVEIGGNVVTVGLGQPGPWRPWAKAGTRNEFWYERLTDGATGLRDLAGNEVRNAGPVTLRNSTGTAPAVTGVAVVSDAGADDTYGRGEKIGVRLTFSKVVNVTGTPRVKIDLSSAAGDEKWADYEDGSGTKTLEFAWTVAPSDASTAGVAVLANTLELNGGTIESALTAGENAALAHAGLAHDPNHKVDGSTTTVSAASVDGNRARLAFNRPLSRDAMPRAADFRVAVQGSGEGAGSARSTRTARSTAALAVTGAGLSADDREVVLTMSRAAADGERLTVRYVPPSSGAGLLDAEGYRVAAFTVKVAVDDAAPPRLVRGEIDGGTMTLFFSEALDEGAAEGRFWVNVQTSGTSSTGFFATGDVAVDGETVTVALGAGNPQARAGLSGRNSVTYFRRADGSDAALRDLAGNPLPTPRTPLGYGGEWRSSAPVALENVTGSAPGVTGVAVVSDAGADKTYGDGDRIRVEVTFSKAVDVTGTPRLRIDMDPARWGEKWAAYERGTGSKSLTFVHTVGEPNLSTQGIAVLANTLALNGGTIRSGGNDADLAHAGLGHDANHKVDWRTAPEESGEDPGGAVGDSGPPSVTGVSVVSSPASGDTYLLGEKISIRVSFGEAVTVTGSPVLSIDMDPAAWGTKQAVFESGGGTSTLTFVHTVVEPNYSTQGIAVLANTLALNGGTIRSTTGANAVLGHTGLGHASGHKVDWRPEISVADARANEGAGASVAFEVSLDRAFTNSGHSVTVDYATSDGSAKAGEDYTATSGTLTFAAGERTKTVNVPVLDDAVDEGEETFTFRLSNATGARIGDGEATGTIANDDPLQKMWLSRFGRTVADHVTTAVSDRLAAPLTGAQVTVGGQRVDLAAVVEDEARVGEALTAVARALGAREDRDPGGFGSGLPGSSSGTVGWPATGLGGIQTTMPGSTPAREVTGRELLLGSAFHLAAEGGGTGPGLAAWGRVTVGGFDGEAPADGGSVRIDGEVTTGILGADAEWNRLLAGVAISVSEGEGTFAQTGVDKGTIESSLTTVSPYARLAVTDRVSVWGLAGFGTGDMTIVQDANDRGQPKRVRRTDIEMRLIAGGGRGALLEADETGGFDLALKADGFYVETEAEAISNEGGTTGVASRVRLALEGSRAFEVGGGTLTPGLEAGLRHDGGDAETGTGVELGGRVSWTDPGTGLSMEARVRTLVAHEDSDYREWGASGSVRLAPGERGRGLSFSLAPTWGAASSGVGRLWSARDAQGLAPGGEFEAERRLEGELGYGLSVFGDRFTGTPNLGFGFSDRARDYRIGWRLTSAVRGDPGFEVNLDAMRRESANPGSGSGAGSGADVPVDHGVMLRAAIRW